LSDFIYINFSQRIFEKYSYLTFNDNPFSGSRVVPCGQTNGRKDGQTDRNGEANSRFSKFCERA